jgi:hypothetical protein
MTKGIINLIYKIMKNKKTKLMISMLLVMAVSCNEPETVLTNIIRPDGSVIRRIEMKSFENNFEIDNVQVPFDSSWTIKDSVEVNDDLDTLWVKRAEKVFADINEINKEYKADSSINKETSRYVEFRKRFRWFNTEYYFSEVIDKNMQYGYPVRNFLNQEELQWFYTPGNINEEKKNGPDSLKFRALSDTIESKTEKWYLSSLVSEWIEEFYKLTKEKAGEEMTNESLKQREDELTGIVERNIEDFDSLWSNGYILREFLGDDNAGKYKAEADSAAELAIEHFEVTFKDYNVRTVMPGILTETNGFIDSTGVVTWPVISDYFLTEQYIMYAESKISNKWAWIVSGLFLVFVFTGIILWQKRRG